MRESIGGTWIFSICMTFILIFTAYLAISVNYTKAFRIKSHIVNMIEDNNGYGNDMEEQINTYLIAQNYSASGKCKSYSGDWGAPRCIDPRSNGECGACIYSMSVDESNDDIFGEKRYFKVVTFFKFDLPILNVLLKFDIKGDSKPLYQLNNVNNNVVNSICD